MSPVFENAAVCPAELVSVIRIGVAKLMTPALLKLIGFMAKVPPVEELSNVLPLWLLKLVVARICALPVPPLSVSCPVPLVGVIVTVVAVTLVGVVAPIRMAPLAVDMVNPLEGV